MLVQMGGDVRQPDGRLAGAELIPLADMKRPRSTGGYNYHPLFPEPTHTIMPVPERINGRRIAIAIDDFDDPMLRIEMRSGVPRPAEINPNTLFGLPPQFPAYAFSIATTERRGTLDRPRRSRTETSRQCCTCQK